MTDKQYWQIPLSEFISVPALIRGKYHPLRSQVVNSLGSLRSLEVARTEAHDLLPDGYEIGRIQDSVAGFVLISPDGKRVGLYQARYEGYLLRLDKKVQGHGLGSRFLAACVDLSSMDAGYCVWHPGCYSDAGLYTSIAAHRHLISHAKKQGKIIPNRVLAESEWAPAFIAGQKASPELMDKLGAFEEGDSYYKEIMAIAAMLAGKKAKLFGFYLKKSPLSAHTYILELEGVGTYQGADKADREEVAAEILADVRQHMGADYLAENFEWRAISLESFCGSKKFNREVANSIVFRIAAENSQ